MLEESDGSNLTELVHEIQFDRGVEARPPARHTLLLTMMMSHPTGHTLNAQMMAPDDGSYQVGASRTRPVISDPGTAIRATTVFRSSGCSGARLPSSEGQTTNLGPSLEAEETQLNL